MPIYIHIIREVEMLLVLEWAVELPSKMWDDWMDEMDGWIPLRLLLLLGHLLFIMTKT